MGPDNNDLYREKAAKMVKFPYYSVSLYCRDVSTGATGATEVAPKFSDTLTLSPPRGADSAHHRRGRN